MFRGPSTGICVAYCWSLTGNPQIHIPFGQKTITVAMQIVLYVCGKVLGGIGCTGVVMADRAGVGAVISVVAVI